jgi:DNA repair protein NreA
MPRSVWSPDDFIGSDSEGPRGKKDYSSLAGGYYAARLASLERLAAMGRQASVLAVREITEDYWAPLGVWVVREVARKAMRAEPKKFATLNEALEEMGRRIATPIGKWKPYTNLATGTAQASLAEFL